MEVSNEELFEEKISIPPTPIPMECRTCGKCTNKYMEIYSAEGIFHKLAEKINEHLPIKIHENDSYPLRCCSCCSQKLLEWHTFVLNCIEANVKFKGVGKDCDDKFNDDECIENEYENFTEDIKLTEEVKLTPTRPKISHQDETSKAIPKVRLRRPSSAITYSFFCDICHKGFTRKHSMEIHLKKHHCRVLVEKPSSKTYKVVINNKIIYQCDICDKTFKNSSNVKRHKVTHTNEKTFCCHLCAATFGTSSSLNRHILNFHNGGKKLACEVCEKLFKTKDSLEAHKSIHSNNRPFVCEICGKSFKQAGGLHTHKIFHFSIFPHKCKICDKKFRRLQDLKLHELVHTGDKPYKCDDCAKKFRSKCQLNKHNKKHSDRK